MLRAFFLLAEAQENERLGEPDDWDALVGFPISVDPEWQRRDLAHRCRFLARWLNEWVKECHVGPRAVSTPSSPWAYRMHVGGLMGALAYETLLAVTRSSSRIFVCSGCSNPYVRTGRRPKAGQNNYCPDCGVRAAWRDSQRRRAKLRKALEVETP